MFESITISFEGDDNMSVNIMRILSLYLASLRCQKKLKPSETQAERNLRKDRHSYQKPEQHRNRQNDPGKPRYRQTAELLWA